MKGTVHKVANQHASSTLSRWGRSRGLIKERPMSSWAGDKNAKEYQSGGASQIAQRGYSKHRQQACGSLLHIHVTTLKLSYQFESLSALNTHTSWAKAVRMTSRPFGTIKNHASFNTIRGAPGPYLRPPEHPDSPGFNPRNSVRIPRASSFILAPSCVKLCFTQPHCKGPGGCAALAEPSFYRPPEPCSGRQRRSGGRPGHQHRNPNSADTWSWIGTCCGWGTASGG